VSQPLEVPVPPVRIQLCGRLSFVVDGTPREDALPGRQGQLLFAFLVLQRRRPVERSGLVEALWGERAPRAAESALSALLSKLRTAMGDLVTGRGVPMVELPVRSWVDVEHAIACVHAAETQLGKQEYVAAYTSALGARYVTERTFLPGQDGEWVEDWRRRLDDVHTRSVAVCAESALRMGGLELAGADRASRLLVEKCPFRESAHALRMEVLEALGNTAEALLVYEQLRARLAEELGTGPGPELRRRHERLLHET
jgi:DNA-binding SARP family transcriptional activator